MLICRVRLCQIIMCPFGKVFEIFHKTNAIQYRITLVGLFMCVLVYNICIFQPNSCQLNKRKPLLPDLCPVFWSFKLAQ